jgi:hypothetical protein
MSGGQLSADDIRGLFGELASELDAAGQRAEIFLVGGAAIALCFDGQRSTRDLDAENARLFARSLGHPLVRDRHA